MMWVGFGIMITLAIAAALLFNKGCHGRPYPLMERDNDRDKDL